MITKEDEIDLVSRFEHNLNTEVCLTNTYRNIVMTVFLATLQERRDVK
jgi:hypothetical protein